MAGANFSGRQVWANLRCKSRQREWADFPGSRERNHSARRRASLLATRARRYHWQGPDDAPYGPKTTCFTEVNSFRAFPTVGLRDPDSRYTCVHKRENYMPYGPETGSACTRAGLFAILKVRDMS